MAHYQNQHTPTPHTDEYGNQMKQTDEFGNPIHHQTAGIPAAGGHGTGGAHTLGYATGITGHHQEGKLHRSGSSSSSSSEDDGEGGRRKKGMKEKIKEKLPGKHNDQTHPAAATTTTPGGGYGGGAHEKKGIMDKIKDKLPGHRDDRHSA